MRPRKRERPTKTKSENTIDQDETDREQFLQAFESNSRYFSSCFEEMLSAVSNIQSATCLINPDFFSHYELSFVQMLQTATEHEVIYLIV